MDPMNQSQSSFPPVVPSAVASDKPKRKPAVKKAAAPKSAADVAKPKKAKGAKKPRKTYTPSPTSKRAIIRPLRAMEKDLQQRLKAVQKQLARMEKLEF
jgi:hypothetical protein